MAFEKSSGPKELLDASWGNRLEGLREAYEYLEMPVRRYLLVVLLPSFVFLLLTVALVLSVDLPLMIALPIPLLGLLGVVAATIYPK